MFRAYYIERDYTRVTGKTADEDIEAYKSFLTILKNSGAVPVSVFNYKGVPFIWFIVDTDTNCIDRFWYYYIGDYDEADEAYENTLEDDYGSDDVEEVVLEDNLIKTLISKKDSFIGGI